MTIDGIPVTSPYQTDIAGMGKCKHNVASEDESEPNKLNKSGNMLQRFSQRDPPRKIAQIWSHSWQHFWTRGFEHNGLRRFHCSPRLRHWSELNCCIWVLVASSWVPTHSWWGKHDHKNGRVWSHTSIKSLMGKILWYILTIHEIWRSVSRILICLWNMFLLTEVGRTINPWFWIDMPITKNPSWWWDDNI